MAKSPHYPAKTTKYLHLKMHISFVTFSFAFQLHLVASRSSLPSPALLKRPLSSEIIHEATT